MIWLSTGIALACVVANGNCEPKTRLLPCHSLTMVPDKTPTEFVFVASGDSGQQTSRRDCSFIFEGLKKGKLELKILNLKSNLPRGDGNPCEDGQINIFNFKETGEVNLIKKMCDNDNEVKVITDTNMAIMSSSLVDGSFTLTARNLDSNDISTDLTQLSPPREEFNSDWLLARQAPPITSTMSPPITSTRGPGHDMSYYSPPSYGNNCYYKYFYGKYKLVCYNKPRVPYDFKPSQPLPSNYGDTYDGYYNSWKTQWRPGNTWQPGNPGNNGPYPDSKGPYPGKQTPHIDITYGNQGNGWGGSQYGNDGNQNYNTNNYYYHGGDSYYHNPPDYGKRNDTGNNTYPMYEPPSFTYGPPKNTTYTTTMTPLMNQTITPTLGPITTATPLLSSTTPLLSSTTPLLSSTTPSTTKMFTGKTTKQAMTTSKPTTKGITTKGTTAKPTTTKKGMTTKKSNTTTPKPSSTTKKVMSTKRHHHFLGIPLPFEGEGTTVSSSEVNVETSAESSAADNFGEDNDATNNNERYEINPYPEDL